MTSYYSTDVDGINSASSVLIVENAEHLIRFIYSNTERLPYNKKDVRIGLVIKILVKSNSNYPADVLQPVVDDIQSLLSDSKYLKTFANPGERKDALGKELSLVNKFIELDDTISLNTTKHLHLHVAGIL